MHCSRCLYCRVDHPHVAGPHPLQLCKIACTESKSGTGLLELLLLLLSRADLCRRLVSSVPLWRCCRYTRTPPATTPSVAAHAVISTICKPGDKVPPELRSIQGPLSKANLLFLCAGMVQQPPNESIVSSSSHSRTTGVPDSQVWAQQAY